MAKLKVEEELLLICDKLSNVIKILLDRYLPIGLKRKLLSFIVNGYTGFMMDRLIAEKIVMGLLFEEISSENFIIFDDKIQTTGGFE